MTHTIRRHGTTLAAALLATGWPGAQAQTPPSEATIAAHVAAATRAAGDDFRGLMSLCKPAPATRPSGAEVDKGIAAQMARPAPAAGRAFDNLSYVGAAWSGAWALQTSDGVILLDALNNAAEAATLIEGGMKRVGLDPASIKTIVVSHAHGDHYGGAPYLVERYHPRVVMSERDWTMIETRLEFASPLWGAPPKRDQAVNDGDRITLGDTTVTVYQTPGHTLGTLTPVFDVKDGATKHRAMLWGGTAFNFGNDVPRLQLYIEATARMARLAEEQHIDVLLSNHPDYDGTAARLVAPRAGTHPFVIGTPGVVRALTVMGECAQAQRDRFILKP
jgi:metallo-beta-lactamase class B